MMSSGKYGLSSWRSGGCGLCLRQGGQSLKLYSVGNPLFAVKLDKGQNSLYGALVACVLRRQPCEVHF